MVKYEQIMDAALEARGLILGDIAIDHVDDDATQCLFCEYQTIEGRIQHMDGCPVESAIRAIDTLICETKAAK